MKTGFTITSNNAVPIWFLSSLALILPSSARAQQTYTYQYQPATYYYQSGYSQPVTGYTYQYQQPAYTYQYVQPRYTYYYPQQQTYTYQYQQAAQPTTYTYQYAQPAPAQTAPAQTTQPAQPTAQPAQAAQTTQTAQTSQTSQTTEAAQPAPAAPAGDPYGFTAWLNATRAQYGLAPVGYDQNLTNWANVNNSHQNSRGLGHFVMGPASRQNSAMGNYASVPSMWMNSPAHRAALLDPTIRWIGIAGMGAYWTFNAY